MQTTRNWTLTPHTSQCRACHYSGYSNLCDYFETGICPLVSFVKSLKKA